MTSSLKTKVERLEKELARLEKEQSQGVGRALSIDQVGRDLGWARTELREQLEGLVEIVENLTIQIQDVERNGSDDPLKLDGLYARRQQRIAQATEAGVDSATLLAVVAKSYRF